ncbi:MAG TPA: adenosylmethionine--8-amino-7-oxononanoate transaminase [Clostridia bacterium]|nr:adenosylmethionine--8-amino-7-oxononanoate transaminase [Clostridia bacterium]
MHQLAKLDHQYVWHPFTQMRDWLKREPIVIVEGDGATVRDTQGREYLDANSSIWTNLHGHRNRRLNAAITRQLNKIAHTSALGFANEPASLLARELVEVANRPLKQRGSQAGTGAGRKPKPYLGKVFFSDDGSTAMEVALKLCYETARRTGLSRRPRFLSLGGAYHGDTVGAVSAGHIDLFHKAYSGLLFKTDQVPAPYCYRCRFNRAKPDRADAREYRQCRWECLARLETTLARKKKTGEPYAGFLFEPLMQGAAGMIAQPSGWLKQAAGMARQHGALLLADEVMTGFGRTGQPNVSLFASHKEGLQPDFLSVAKGLTGGYLPMAATLTTQRVYDAFLGEYAQFKTFFHGHSFTANQLGAAAGLESLSMLQSAASIRQRATLEKTFTKALNELWECPLVGDIRQVGLVAGIELVKDWKTRQRFPLEEQAGIRVCDAMAKRGVLTRPVGSVIVLMPPYCSTTAEIRRMTGTLFRALEVLR